MIKTYEGFFDFLKFSIESKVEACKEVLNGKDYQMVTKRSGYVQFSYPITIDSKDFKVEILIGEISSQHQDLILNVCDLGGVVLDRQNYGVSRLSKNEFISSLKKSIQEIEHRIDSYIKANDFFLDYTKEDIEDYLSDLRDEIDDDIIIKRDHYNVCWEIQFHTSGIQKRDLIDEHISNLEELLGRVNLKLVRLTDKPESCSYLFRICRKS